MGQRGPVPKRSTQRRRRNQTPEVDKVEAGKKVDAPKPNSRWHPVAKRWFSSLAESGQATFYEPSDWATAYLIAESISRELKPQPMLVKKGDGTEIEMVHLPPKGASLAAWLKGMSSLLVTEGDRRRAQVELQRAAADDDEEATAGVSEIDEFRRRLRGGSAS